MANDTSMMYIFGAFALSLGLIRMLKRIPPLLARRNVGRSGAMRHTGIVARLTVLALLLAGCGGAPSRSPASADIAAQPTSQALAAAPATASSMMPGATPSASPTMASTKRSDEIRFSMSGWKTDFTKHSVPLSEISSGGPPRDGIPPIDQPSFETLDQANRWLKAREPVIHFAIGNDVRAYPLQILTWHEIVNDEVGDVPVAITFCPLCNTAIAFDRRLNGRTLDFGTSGNLRHSDLVMWDRQTESWWQQITGEAIVGALTGRQLQMLPATIVAWEAFARQFPHGRVLSRETGFDRNYGDNPYVGYDKVDNPPFLFDGELDGRLPPKERVVTVSLSGEDVAIPFSTLAVRRVISDTVGGQPVVVFWQEGTASALDQSEIAASRDVGATGVYKPEVDGRRLTFAWEDGAFVDRETGSRWSVLGQASAGPLQGKQLASVVHANHFWFAWAAFKPGTRIVR